MTQFDRNSIFWIEVEKIKANPYQPRREFDQAALQSLAESIRQYGVLQPLVVTRTEVEKPDGGLASQYELIAGERRLRASRIAGLSQVPVVIKSGNESSLMKLELAIIENIQREDLNAIDRAKAFERLVSEFKFKHHEVAQKIGKSREYVTNSIRLLSLPEHIQEAVVQNKISEGHARPLLMLNTRPEEQETLFKEVMYKKLTVREAETIARKVAHDRVRKKMALDPETAEIEEKLAESLGTRVHIERKENGGKITIDFFTNEDLHNILKLVRSNNVGGTKSPLAMIQNFLNSQKKNTEDGELVQKSLSVTVIGPTTLLPALVEKEEREIIHLEDTQEENVTDKDTDNSESNLKDEQDEDDDIYSIRNFSI